VNDSDDTLDLITPFVDGELSAADAKKVEQHMQSDDGYQFLVNLQRATKHALGARLTRVTAPAALEQRIRHAVFGSASPVRERRGLGRILTWNPALASAVGAVVLIAALTIVILTFNGNRIIPYVEDVYAHHMDPAYFPIMFEFNGDYGEVAKATSQAVGFDIIVPRLGVGIEPEGARKCTLCDHLMAFIKYRGEDARVSFFILPKARPAIWRLERRDHPEGTFYWAEYQGLRMVFWEDRGTTYCVAADMPEDDVIALARSAYIQVCTCGSL
jgi:anti-sigma factor RsiW